MQLENPSNLFKVHKENGLNSEYIEDMISSRSFKERSIFNKGLKNPLKGIKMESLIIPFLYGNGLI